MHQTLLSDNYLGRMVLLKWRGSLQQGNRLQQKREIMVKNISQFTLLENIANRW
jgi:hypothetical protein